MKRVAAAIAAITAAVAFWTFAGGAGSNKPVTYDVIFDNAFGLIDGGDLKIAGVRAGKITKLELERKTLRARVSFQIDKTDFGGLRTDVRCEIRPQSLIGEYFVDCLPGTAKQVLKPGSVIPVEKTASTVPADLVVDIMRRPYAQRFSIIISQLGAGVGGGGEGLNEALRRASPALRETSKLLNTLSDQSATLKALARDADHVVGALAGNRRDVGRFVQTAERTATASAERKAELAAGLRRLPVLLEELRPTMAALDDTAVELTPTLRNLDASAVRLRTFFDRLGPFSEASRPAIRALGRMSVTGSSAVRAATPTVAQLNRFARGTPELGKNLAIVLKHLDNRENAVEEDPRSPGGKGYTGLEALLQYVMDQTLSTNLFNRDSHMLKVTPILGRCANYADVERLKEPGIVDECGAALGPNQPGINFPDPTKPAGVTTPSSRRRQRSDTAPSKPQQPKNALGLPDIGPKLPQILREPENKLQLPKVPPLPKLPALPKLGGDKGPLGLGGDKGPLGLGLGGRSDGRDRLLDYLLGP